MEVKCEKLSNRFDYVCCDNHLTASLSFERMENAHITVFFSVKFIIDVSYRFHCFSITRLFLVVYHNKEPN